MKKACSVIPALFVAFCVALAIPAQAGLFEMLNKKPESSSSSSADQQLEQMNKRRAEGNESRSSESEKLSEKMRQHMKSEGMDEGCLVKQLKVKQYSLGGGKWAGVQVLDANKGYQPFDCKNWPKETAHKLPTELTSYRQSLVDACGKGSDHTMEPIVRFGNPNWAHANDDFYPHKSYRWLEGACFSRYKIK